MAHAPTSTDLRRKALFAQTTSATLVESLLILEPLLKSGTATGEQRMARAWTIDELEERFPAAAAAITAAFDAAEVAALFRVPYVEVDYVAILLANINL